MLQIYMSLTYGAGEDTFFKGLKKLLPGRYLIWKDGKVEIHRYWTPKFQPDESKSLEDWADEIHSTLKSIMPEVKTEDETVESFLSSGVDSSYVLAMSDAKMSDSCGYDEERFDESRLAKKTAELLGREHSVCKITPQQYFDIVPYVMYNMEQPLGDASAIVFTIACNATAEHTKICYSGEGADEFFGGYNIYKEPLDTAGYRKLPKGLRKGLANVAQAIPFKFKGKNFLIRGSKDIEERFIGNAFMFNEKERAKILKNPTGKYDHKELTKPFYDKVKDKDDVTKMQYIDINFWLIGDILLKADKMSMAHSLEVRVPFLDREVFDVARTIPTKYKVNKSNTKYAMRMAAHKYLPDMVAEKKKLGFPVPIRIWLKDDKYYNMIKKAFTSEAAEKYFNTKELVKYLDDHKEGKADNSRKIWTVYMFLVWYNDFFGDSEYAA